MSVIVRPIVTEKMNSLGTSLKKYGFIVSSKANKLQIKNAVEKLYGVNVEAVNTITYGGKLKSRNTRSGVIRGKESGFKKAIVTLAKNDVIDFYSNI